MLEEITTSVHRKRIARKLGRYLHIFITLTFIINMSFLGALFNLKGVGAQGAVSYNLQAQKKDNSFTSNNICQGVACYSDGDSIPVKLIIEGLTASSTYKVVVGHNYKNATGTIAYDRFENPGTWDGSASSVIFSNSTTTASGVGIEYDLDFTALSETVSLKWDAVLGANASNFNPGSDFYLYLVSGVNDEILSQQIPIDMSIGLAYCGDGIINQPSEECDGSDMPAEYDNAGFTCKAVSCTVEEAINTCKLDSSKYDYVLDFSSRSDFRVVSYDMNSKNLYPESNPYDVSALNIEDGDYEVTLYANDYYLGRNTVVQDNEQLQVAFYDASDNQVAITGENSDLADSVSFAEVTEKVNSKLTLNNVNYVKAEHAHKATATSSSPNSLQGVCLGLKKVVPPATPSCGDGIVNQVSEQCDGTDGLIDQFTCNSSCELEPIVPDCSLNLNDYDKIIDLRSYLSSNSSSNALRSDVYAARETDKAPVNVETGDYSVTLEAYDMYADRENTSPQPNEYFKLEFYNGNTVTTVTSGHSDLPDGVRYGHVIEEVDASLRIDESDGVKAVHGVYPDYTSPNSVVPLCAGLKKVEPETPDCSLNPNDYDMIIDFNGYKLISNNEAQSKSSGIYTNISEGKYDITLEAYDGYSDRFLASQDNEQYQLVFYKGGNAVATSSPHDDLQDLVVVAHKTQIVDTDLNIPESDMVKAVHAAYPNYQSPNSVDAICAGLNKKAEEPKDESVTPSFDYSEFGCISSGSNVDISFTNTSSGATSSYAISWDFGDGATSTEENPSHSYSAAGSYDVVLTLTPIATSSSAVVASSTQTITINDCTTNTEGPGGSYTGGGGGGSSYNPFGINNTQITMRCENNLVNMDISWITTDNADSRIVYDTSSHNILGSAPNYGYSNSTVLYPNKVIGHTVAINGLQPDTVYYFRPISTYNGSETVGNEKYLTKTLSCETNNEVIVLGEEGKPILSIDSDFLIDFANPGTKNIDYKIVVTNSGDLTSYTTVLSSVLPDGIIFSDSKSDSKVWQLGDLDPNESRTIMTLVDVKIDTKPGTYTATATVFSSNHEEVDSQTDLPVRDVKVLAETGFSPIELGGMGIIMGMIVVTRNEVRRRMNMIRNNDKLSSL